MIKLDSADTVSKALAGGLLVRSALSCAKSHSNWNKIKTCLDARSLKRRDNGGNMNSRYQTKFLAAILTSLTTLMSLLIGFISLVSPCDACSPTLVFSPAAQQAQATQEEAPQEKATQSQTPEPKEPVLAEASDEGAKAIEAFQVPDDLDCTLFASEPMVGNPVALHVDFQGRLFVAESYRQEKGIEDNRKHSHWMDEELAAQTVADRIAYIRKYIDGADQKYTENDDRIRLLEDTNGDGKADKNSVFANHFNNLEMGTGAGVLSYNGKVYYTCIPDVFELTDADNDGSFGQSKIASQRIWSSVRVSWP